MESQCEAIYDGLDAINGFMSAVYHLPLWVSPDEADRVSRLGMTFLRNLNQLAIWSLEKSLPRFKVMAKFHLFSHMCHAMRRSSREGHYSINILAYACQLDEDFVGRVAHQSRHVSIRKVPYRGTF